MEEKLYEDNSYEELLPLIIKIRKEGGTFWGKFTCKRCGSRQTFEEENRLFTRGKCEECGYISKLDKWGLLVLF